MTLLPDCELHLCVHARLHAQNDTHLSSTIFFITLSVTDVICDYDVLLLCLLFPCIVYLHFHFIIVLFFLLKLAIFITCY